MNKGFTPTLASPGLTRRAALQATTAAVAAGAAPCALAQAGAKKDAKEAPPRHLANRRPVGIHQPGPGQQRLHAAEPAGVRNPAGRG